ncbi:DNA/RNA non-specific endonuclease [Amycolatopsis sp. NPDC059021]|uniref:DNA/RNA non-specific endonuclease n=1 Tax=Amycolatopsis sp. NPDC059021 TaxID=3346704 RepID=UPI00366B7A30
MIRSWPETRGWGRRRFGALALALLVLLPVAGSAVEYAKPDEALPLGASSAAPGQRHGSAPGSGGSDRLASPPRDSPRPPGAVADRAAPPPALEGTTAAREHVQPALAQRNELPAIDPKAVERAQDRTASTETFDNPDGTRTLRVHTGQTNTRQPDGGWKPNDPALRPGPDGRLRPGVSPVDVSFAPAADDAAVARLALDGGHSLSYALDDAAAAPGTAAGGEIAYRAVRPDTDLRLSSTAEGLKEDLVLTSPRAQTSYSFTLRTTGLRLQQDGGEIRLLDETGAARGTIPAGFMTDSGAGPGARGDGVRYHLVQLGAGTWRLRLDLDEAWLRDPARVFPVVVDPSVGKYATETDDTYVRSGSTADHSGEIDLEVGSANGGRTISRSYLHFANALNSLRNQYIVGATVNVLAVYSCQPRPVTLFEATQGWGGNSQWPGAAAGRALATTTVPALGGGCAGQSWTPFPLPQDLAVQWSHGGAFGNGFTLRAANEGDSSAFKRFASANTVNKPYLDVRYSPEGAAYQLTDVLLPTNTREGTFTAKVTNQGSSLWPAGGGYRLGYLVKQNGTVIKSSQGVAPPVAVPPGGQATITVPLTALAPGEYELLLTMWNPAGEDFHVAYEVPYGSAPLKVNNVPPGSNYQQPGTGAVVETLTPTLFARAVDDDNWPNKGFTFLFRICSDAALTQNCTESGWGPESWTPPLGKLSWSKTFYWGVKTHDTVSPSPQWIGPLAVTTRVPQPEITSHLAGSPDSVNGPGLDPQIGNYSTVVTDANVATAGPDLTITRTYNSLDPRRDTAFGVGWASRLDTRLVPNRTADNVVIDALVTYSNGRQARFGRNPDGTFAPPAGQNVDLTYNSANGYYTLRDVTGSTWLFDAAGRMILLTDPAGLTEKLEYDSADHVTAITNQVSGRALAITWNGAHVAKVRTAAPKPGEEPLTWTYTYEGDSLTTVCAPGGAPNCTKYSRVSGSHYLSSVLDDGPRGYWRLGETGGPTVANAVARTPGADAGQQHGLSFGGAGALAGTDDPSAAFDGMASYLTLPDNLFNEQMSVSAELWFKTTTGGTLLGYAEQPFPGTAGKRRPVLYVGFDGLLYGGFSARDVTGPSQVVSQKQVNDGTWHHAVLTSAINRQTLYLDGAPIGDVAGIIDHGTMGKLVAGAGAGAGFPSTNGGDYYFAGAIDEVALYQHTLSPFAVKQHFGAGQAADQLTGITLPQDDRQYARIGYDNRADRVRSLTDHDGRSWTLDTPARNNAERVVTLHGPYPDWTYKFDADQGGRLTATVHKGFTKVLEYNEKGFLRATVDETGNRVERTTDDRGNMLSSKTCRAPGSCNTAYFTYVTSADPLDPRRDKLASSSDARSTDAKDERYRTSYTYDPAGRLTGTKYPIPVGQTTAPTETRTYATGAEAAAGGGKVPAGLLIRTTDRRGQEAAYDYRVNGDLASSRDVMGLVTQFGYDGIGRKITETATNAGGGDFGTTTVEYTPRSQVATVTAPAVKNPVTGVTHTQVTRNSYDGDGNLLETRLTDATGGDPERKTTFGYDAHDHRVEVGYPDGGVVRYAYSPDLLRKVTTDVLGTQWTDQFDDQRRLLSRVASGPGANPAAPGDGTLTVETRSYDPAGRLERTQDAMGRSTRFAYYGDGLPAVTTLEGYRPPGGAARDVVLEQRGYDPAGHVTQLVTAGGRKTVTGYDPAGYVSESTVDPDTLKRKTTYLRDGAGNPTKVTATGAAEPDRRETTDYTYAPNGQVLREEVPASAGELLTTSATYDARGLRTSATDRRQAVTQFTYDVAGQPVSTIRPAVDVWVNGQESTGQSLTETLGHNAFGEVTHSKDPSGNVTLTERDVMGRATAGTLPAYTPPGGQPIVPVTRTEYDRAGNAVKTTDPLGRSTSNTYDPYGRVTTTTLPQAGEKPSVITNTYDGMGELLSTTDPAGARREFTYDELGRRITATDAERFGGQTAYYTSVTDYDDAGNVVAEKTPQGFVSTTAYNNANEVISRTDATNRTVRYGYDDHGRQISATDPAGLVQTTTFDLAGRATGTAQLVDGKPQRTSSNTYDGNGNLVRTVSPEGRTTDFGYDFLNRTVKQVEKVDAAKSITTWTGYDRLGNRSHFVDGNGNATEYTFTPWGKPESVVEPAVAGATAPEDRTWTTSYDAGGRAVTLTAPGGVRRNREYDAQARLIAEHGSGAEQATADRTYGYDLAGRLTKIGSPGGDTLYTYDDRGNLRTSQGATGTAVYNYNGDGTLASRSDAAGAASFTYDAAGRLTSAADPVTGRTLDYGYDAAGRPSYSADRAVAGRISRSTTYDKLGRIAADELTQTTDTGSRVVLGESYGYDKDDKVTSKTSTRPGGTTANTYGYDGAGRLTSWSAGTQTTKYGWDDAGNRTSVNDQAYTYNERNQLLSGGGATYAYSKRGTVSSATKAGVTTTNGFDAFDRLVRQGSTEYQYDSKDRVQSRNGAALTYDGLTNETVTDGTRTVSRLPDGTALADKGSAGGKLLFTDRHDDVVARYLGASVDGQRTFDPSGRVLASSGDTSNLGYQGDWTSPDTGDVNMTARWYSPDRGSFLSRDDWNPAPSPSTAANRYTYGNGDAVGITDPSGHCPICLAPVIPAAAEGLGTLLGWLTAGAIGTAAVDQCIRHCSFSTPRPRAGSSSGAWAIGSAIAGAFLIARLYLAGRWASEWGRGGGTNVLPGARPGSLPGRWPGGRLPGGRFGGPRIPAPPPPPPPPPWIAAAVRAAAQTVAGGTVKPIADAVSAVTGTTQVMDPGAEYSSKANRIIDVGAESLLYLRAVQALGNGGPNAVPLGSGKDDDNPCGGWVDYGPPVSATGNRATGIVAKLCAPLPSGTRTDIDVAPEGHTKTDGRGHNYDKLHLLAKSLGGSGSDLRNLVTGYANAVNRSQMTRVERAVRKAVEGGEQIYYRVTPIYIENRDDLDAYGNKNVPAYIIMDAIGNKGTCAHAVITNRAPRRETTYGGGCG